MLHLIFVTLDLRKSIYTGPAGLTHYPFLPDSEKCS
jgi:hypothetical protein